MKFEFILKYLRDDYFPARRGAWKDTGEFVVMQKGYPQGIPCNLQTAKAWGLEEGDLFKCNPYFQKKNEDGSHSMWTPTLDDMLADDWEVVLVTGNGIVTMAVDCKNVDLNCTARTATWYFRLSTEGALSLKAIFRDHLDYEDNLSKESKDLIEDIRYQLKDVQG